MTPQEIKFKILQGENLLVEFKEKFSNLDSLAAEICALANTEGGTIFFGVADDKEIKGLKDYQKIEEQIMNLLRHNLEPSFSAKFVLTEIDNKVIGILNVPKSYFRPHKTNQGRYYIRVGTTKRYPSREELARIYQDVGQIRYDLAGIQATNIRDLDLDKVNDYYRRFYNENLFSSQLGLEQTLVNLEFLTDQADQSGKKSATVAGLLFFGREPQKFLPQSAVSVGVYDGKNLAAPMKNREEIKGTLVEVFEQVWDYVKRHLEINYEYLKGKRTEVLEYSEIAIREMIVNALVHRNYSIDGEQIRVFLFKDKMWVSSPGRLPNTITLDNITFRRHARNPLITEIMWNLGYVEKSGSGILRIIKAMQKHNQTVPKLEIEGEEFRVTIFNERG